MWPKAAAFRVVDEGERDGLGYRGVRSAHKPFEVSCDMGGLWRCLVGIAMVR